MYQKVVAEYNGFTLPLLFICEKGGLITARFKNPLLVIGCVVGPLAYVGAVGGAPVVKVQSLGVAGSLGGDSVGTVADSGKLKLLSIRTVCGVGLDVGTVVLASVLYV